MKHALPLAILGLILAACSSASGTFSDEIAARFDAGDSAPVDLRRIGPPSWDRLCILGPYSNNATAEQTLGFPWDVESRSSIGNNEGIDVLVFVRGREVVAYTEHRRSKGDFLTLENKCLVRSRTRLVRQARPGGLVQWVPQ